MIRAKKLYEKMIGDTAINQDILRHPKSFSKVVTIPTANGINQTV